MQYEWDDEKSKSNRVKHGIAFESMEDFDWSFARLDEIEHVEGEEREAHVGPIGMTLYRGILTERGDRLRIISIRRAENAEIVRWREDYHG